MSNIVFKLNKVEKSDKIKNKEIKTRTNIMTECDKWKRTQS